MVNANKYGRNKFGMTAGFAAVVLVAVLALNAGTPPSALAETSPCGTCHGTAPIASRETGHRAGYSSTPWYEDTKTPVDGDICGKGRGLHGIHMNYSSGSFGGSGTNTIPAGFTGAGSAVIRHGNCNYCHNKHGDNTHENGFVGFSGMSPTVRQKVDTKGVHYVDTGNTITNQANGVALSNLYGAGTCTKACHQNTSATSPAPWGNYTTSTVRLSCNACHSDYTTRGTGLTGLHFSHISSLGSASNAVCNTCHGNYTGEGRATADDGTSKAYPHASDGTNVVPTNATVTSSKFTFTPSGSDGTAGTCYISDGTGCHHGTGTTTGAWSGH